MPNQEKSHKEGQKLTEGELSEWLGVSPLEKEMEEAEVKEPQIVTEIYRDGVELGLPTSQIDKDLIACTSTEDVRDLRDAYFARLASRDLHISLDLDGGWTVARPMTEEEFDNWVKSRSTPEELVEEREKEQQPILVMDEIFQEVVEGSQGKKTIWWSRDGHRAIAVLIENDKLTLVAYEWSESMGSMSQCTARSNILPTQLISKVFSLRNEVWGSRDRDEGSPIVQLDFVEDKGVREAYNSLRHYSEGPKVAQRTKIDKEQEPLPLPYALKVEMLVEDMRGLLVRQDVLEHQFRHTVAEREIAVAADDAATRKALAKMGIDASEEEIAGMRQRGSGTLEAMHSAAHNNLDADLTDLTNRVKKLEAVHWLDNV